MRNFSSFLGRMVETESGRRFGRCHDMRASVGRGHPTVEALVVGRRGLLEHFGIVPLRLRDAIPWDAVVRIEGDRIVVRDGTELL
jgi:sporulation protein YlmC with PRC-barrel domain